MILRIFSTVFACKANMKKHLIFLVFLFSFLILPAVSMAEDDLLKKSGILYPEGYDLNTVTEVKGILKNLVLSEKGPAHFTLLSGLDSYVIFMSPRWYLEDLNFSISEGTEITVVGSKSMGKDGNLYIIAREIKLSNNQVYSFRGKSGMPLWRGNLQRERFPEMLRSRGGAGKGRR